MTTVINIKNKTGAVNEVYIGRPSALGNPIAIGKPCMICGQKHDRGGTLVCYRIYLVDRLIKDPEFRDLVISLKGKTLVCFCKPAACHGDILAEATEILSTWSEKDIMNILTEDKFAVVMNLAITKQRTKS